MEDGKDLGCEQLDAGPGDGVVGVTDARDVLHLVAEGPLVAMDLVDHLLGLPTKYTGGAVASASSMWCSPMP